MFSQSWLGRKVDFLFRGRGSFILKLLRYIPLNCKGFSHHKGWLLTYLQKINSVVAGFLNTGHSEKWN